MNGPLLSITREWYRSSGVYSFHPRFHNTTAFDGIPTQRTQALALLKRRGMTRLAEFHEAGKVWIAIGRKDWRPRFTYPPIRIARFSDELLRRSVEFKSIAETPVPVFGVAKMVADLFRYRRTVGDTLAIEGLRQALRQRKATPAEIAHMPAAAGMWATMEPYVMALTRDA